ncbi:MAG: RNA-binding transcriptional accessory protein [Alphaproteobacteria bacterium]|nr:RNA-binding transcriptional accessory protein [Alphaproteobacteria bacterium]
MIQEVYARIIVSEMALQESLVLNTINLLESGATIPFIARYRKEMTGSMDETVIAAIRDRLSKLKELDARRAAIIKSLTEQEKLTPELREAVEKATTMADLEDVYLPYKPKRKTRASVARERGLEPLAGMILSQRYDDIQARASKFIDESKGVATVEDAIRGACDIIAEIISEDGYTRKRIRSLFQRESKIVSKVVKGKDQEGINFEMYFDYVEPLNRAPSHRILAMFRGENEGFLRLSVEVEEAHGFEIVEKIFVKGNNASSELVKAAAGDSCKRLLFPSIETEMRQWAKEKADREAIRVFVENLRQLLLAPPLGRKNVLAIDPGFRTGCKVVCLDRQGKLIHNETIYPHPPQNEVKESIHKLKTLVNAYKIEAIAIGNGTAGRETERLVRSVAFDRDLIALVVNESGASVYSASAAARKEFPDYDVTVRGSVSIGRRLMDPLAELVKIDPKSIGVGQYQHDVDQNLLMKSLDDTVVSCVNRVGVEVNTASEELLTYVSGVGPSLAKNIISYRDESGPFRSRTDFRKVARFGDKAFEQAAGFLRIHDAENLLDRSAVHPESYHIVDRMVRTLSCTLTDLITNAELRGKIHPEDFVDERVGLPTLNDIMAELAKPGRDPRQQFEIFEFDKTVHSINDLKKGMILPGIVTNITNFGAFVDIGVHQDGLVHVSQLADRFVRDPNDVVKLNQKVMVEVLDVDPARKRIQLSMKGVQNKT